MSDKVKIAIIGAGNRYMFAYSWYIKNHSNDIEIEAISDISEKRRQIAGDFHGLKEEQIFEDWMIMLEYIKDKGVKGVFITTSDKDHYKPAIECLKRGYNLLLEKPMSPSVKECVDIVALANEKKLHVIVAHVLRYTPFFTRIRDIIKSGVIGSVQSIAHNENIFSFHMAHSFVRGNWGNSDTSSPIILAKSCHDLDILIYLIGDERECARVSSFGSLGHFKKECAPIEAPYRCSDKCPVYKTCPYSVDIYFDLMKRRERSFATVVAPENTGEALTEALKTSPYGRCVYHCDNNVCDHMSSILEFDDGSTATFSLSAFTDDMSRTIKIMGSHGQIRGNTDNDTVEVSLFGKGERDYRNGNIKIYNPLKEAQKGNEEISGHDGGDDRFMEGFVKTIRGEANPLTSASVSLKSHLMAFALEKSRLEHKVINMSDFIK